MPSDRFYTNTERLNSGLTITVQDQEFHHMVHVMRAKIGDSIELVNGKGSVSQGILTSIEKKKCQVEIENHHFVERDNFELILVQAIPRASRLDFILEKGTELGVTQFWLWPSKLSEKKDFNSSQIDRMEGQTIAAMKQCGRLYLPTIKVMKGLDKEEKLPFEAFFGDVKTEAPTLSKEWKNPKEQLGVVFFTGPESGFTPDEIECLTRLGVKGVKLHENILRTDTASLVALSLFSHLRLT